LLASGGAGEGAEGAGGGETGGGRRARKAREEVGAGLRLRACVRISVVLSCLALLSYLVLPRVTMARSFTTEQPLCKI